MNPEIDAPPNSLGFHSGPLYLRFRTSWVWPSVAPRDSEDFCHTLWVESQGGTLEALCSRKNASYIFETFKRNQLYIIRNYRVITPRHDHKASLRSTCLLFTEEADIRIWKNPSLNTIFPRFDLFLTPIDQIQQQGTANSHLIDVASRIASFSPPTRQPDGTCHFIMEDSSNAQVCLRLSGQLSTWLDADSLAGLENLGPIVLAFTKLFVLQDEAPHLSINTIYLANSPATQCVHDYESIQLLPLTQRFTDSNIPITIFPMPPSGPPKCAQGKLPERKTVVELTSLFTTDPTKFTDYYRCKLRITEELHSRGWLCENCPNARVRFNVQHSVHTNSSSSISATESSSSDFHSFHNNK